MKKKIITVLLAVSVCSTLLAGCGSEKNDAAQTEQATEQTTEKVAESTETVTEIVTEESTESVEAVAENTETEEAESPYSYTDQSATMYAQRNVNVRDLPDTNGNKVGGLSTNQEVTVTGQCNETGWYRIAFGDGEAYVSNSYLGNSKVETTSTNTGTSSNSGSTQATTPSNDNGGGNSDAGSNSTASEELPSNPYPLNTLVEDTGSSISYYLLETLSNGVSNGAPDPTGMSLQAANYILNIGKTPGETKSMGTCGEYKEGIIWKYTKYYN